MKRFFILLTLVFSAVAMKAQSDQTPEQRAHIQAMHLQKLVSTNDVQTSQAEVIFLAKIKEINAVNHDVTKTSTEKETAIAAIRVDKDNQLKAILTPDQYTVYQTKMAQISARQNGAQ